MNCLDLIIKGNVVTMVNQKPRAKAIGVKDGRIAVVGGVEEMEKIAGDTTQILDLKDKTIPSRGTNRWRFALR